MKIGIFGGSFNPPHKMHKAIVKELIKKDYLNKVIVVPVADSYAKPYLLKGEDRFNMTKDVFKLCDNVDVSNCEIVGKQSFTIDTLNYYKKVYPNDELFFVLGTDLFKDFDKWKNYEEVLSKYKLMVISREKNDFYEILKKFEKYKDKIILADVKPRNLSSTIIRNEILKNGYTEKLKDYLYVDTIKYLKKLDVKKYWKS